MRDSSVRAIAAKAGLRAAFAFPIQTGTQLEGVMEFFLRDAREPDQLADAREPLDRLADRAVHRAQDPRRSRSDSLRTSTS